MKKSCGAATFDLCIKDPSSLLCTKFYAQLSLTLRGNNIPGGTTVEQLQQFKNRIIYVGAILPIDATSLVVSWNLITTSAENPNDLTRYIISVDRFKGCDISPVLKFRVPVACVPKNDCEQSQQSQLAGTTQPFGVNLCAGDTLLVGLTTVLAEDCGPVVCGVQSPVTPNPNPTPLDMAFFNLCAF